MVWVQKNVVIEQVRETRLLQQVPVMLLAYESNLALTIVPPERNERSNCIMQILLTSIHYVNVTLTRYWAS